MWSLYMIITGDSLKKLKKLKDQSVDFIFSDPPYFLSNNGISCSAGKMVSVNKGDWDRGGGSEPTLNFTKPGLQSVKEY